MSVNKKTAIIAVVGLLQFYFIACSGDKSTKEIEAPVAKVIIQDGYKQQALVDHAGVITAPPVVSQVIEEEEWVVNKEKIIAIKYPDDTFDTFRCAFFAARKELGPGKYFVWKDNVYTTMWEDEPTVN